jgi:RNA polymerase sigma-70 factor (ECF subfamily)
MNWGNAVMMVTSPSIASEARLRDPDVVLMLRVQRDESGAFEELVSVYWSRVFGRFFRQFGDRQEAEDLVQDVFLRLFRNRKRYRPRAKFATWLFHISRNVARNAIRTRRRRPVTPMAFQTDCDDEAPLRGRVAETDVPSRRLERAEVARLVRSAVASLKGRQRVAVELQCRDHSYGEIAAELDMTAKAAKSLLYRARNELRQTLLPLTEVLA